MCKRASSIKTPSEGAGNRILDEIHLLQPADIPQTALKSAGPLKEKAGDC
jgi:hypothetical protein